MTLAADELLAAYDAQLRLGGAGPLPAGASVEHDGPLHRFTGFEGGGFVLYRDLAGLEGRELDTLIARQIEVFAQRDEQFEWKLHGHDLPRELGERLEAAGLVPGAPETVLIAPVEAVIGDVRLPEGVSLRDACERGDIARIAALESTIWDDDRAWLAASLEAELEADPAALEIVLAEHGDDLLSAGWVRFVAGSGFATLWGGGTLPAWRGRGIYRALVAERAKRARQRGFRYLQVDASDDSRPILERLGFVSVTTSTPFIWTPANPR
jgi:GNAT superfamily N-acetyltransferase